MHYPEEYIVMIQFRDGTDITLGESAIPLITESHIMCKGVNKSQMAFFPIDIVKGVYWEKSKNQLNLEEIKVDFTQNGPQIIGSRENLRNAHVAYYITLNGRCAIYKNRFEGTENLIFDTYEEMYNHFDKLRTIDD